MTNTLSQNIAQYFNQDFSQKYSNELIEHAKVALADLVCVSMAALNEEINGVLANYAQELGGAPQSTLMGSNNKVSRSQAALLNGALAHALDYDDSLDWFQGHPSVTLLPALLAEGEHSDLSGKRVLLAYLAGLHGGCWVSAATSNEHYYAGWHGTATIGRQASAIASSVLMGLSPEQMTYALGVSATQAAGVKQSFGSMAKPLHAGMAAQGGLEAALMAKNGFVSASDALEGRLGFINLHGGSPQEADPDQFQSHHPVERLTHKFHASCHNTHASIEFVLSLADQGLKHSDVEEIQIHCPQITIDNAGQTDPQTGLEGKFSIYYAVANAWVTGKTGLTGFTDEAVHNVDVREFMPRIHATADEAMREAGVSARTIVKFKDGQIKEATINPMESASSLADKQVGIKRKFFDLMSLATSEAQATEVYDQIQNFETANIKEFMQALNVS